MHDDVMFLVAILCGGLGTRLGPLTQDFPKALVSVNGKPFIKWQLDLLQANKIYQAVLCVGHQAGQIRQYMNDSYAGLVDIYYSHDEFYGTGGAIKKALPLLGKQFFVMYGDSYLDCDYATIQKAFVDSGKSALLTIYRNENRWDKSNVGLYNGEIVSYEKQPREELSYIDYGLGVFNRDVFRNYPAVRFDLSKIYQELIRKRDLAIYEISERFYEIGSLKGLEETCRHLQKAS